MARIDVDQDTVLTRLVAHLQSTLSLNARQCFPVVDPDQPPELPVGGTFFVGVGVAEGQLFPDEQISGNISEDSDVEVTGYSRIHLDSADHDEKLYQETNRGTLILKKKLIKAVAGVDLTTAGGDNFLRQPMYVKRASRTQYDGDQMIAWITITIGVDFDCDIT